VAGTAALRPAVHRLLAAAGDGRGGDGALGMVLGLAGFAVALGYVYVVAAGVLYRLLRRRGVIHPEPAAAG
jgi:hypothetical protein